MEIKEHEYCLRCGRKLKNPIARQKGYGAVCERKMKTPINSKPLIGTNLWASKLGDKIVVGKLQS